MSVANGPFPVGGKAIRLPHPDPRLLGLLPGARFADSYRWRSAAGVSEAPAWLDRVLAKPPHWVGRLMALRNGIAGRLGLKAAAIEGFPVLHHSPDRIVVGLDDWHLDFRIACFCDRDSGGTLVTMGTIVRPHHPVGQAYLAMVMPFHRLISHTLVGRASSGSGEL